MQTIRQPYHMLKTQLGTEFPVEIYPDEIYESDSWRNEILKNIIRDSRKSKLSTLFENLEFGVVDSIPQLEKISKERNIHVIRGNPGLELFRSHFSMFPEGIPSRVKSEQEYLGIPRRVYSDPLDTWNSCAPETFYAIEEAGLLEKTVVWFAVPPVPIPLIPNCDGFDLPDSLNELYFHLEYKDSWNTKVSQRKVKDLKDSLDYFPKNKETVFVDSEGEELTREEIKERLASANRLKRLNEVSRKTYIDNVEFQIKEDYVIADSFIEKQSRERQLTKVYDKMVNSTLGSFLKHSPEKMSVVIYSTTSTEKDPFTASVRKNLDILDYPYEDVGNKIYPSGLRSRQSEKFKQYGISDVRALKKLKNKLVEISCRS